MTPDLGPDLVAYLPHLRAVARILTRDRCEAEDLVQETAVLALSHARQFQPGTNLKAWLTTIMRNSHCSTKRAKINQPHVDIDTMTDSLKMSAAGPQEGYLYLGEFKRAFRKLSPNHRQALLLVGASGYSHDQAARLAGCAIGTMKSRVFRARFQVSHFMEHPEEIHPVRDRESRPLSLLHN